MATLGMLPGCLNGDLGAAVLYTAQLWCIGVRCGKIQCGKKLCCAVHWVCGIRRQPPKMRGTAIPLQISASSVVWRGARITRKVRTLSALPRGEAAKELEGKWLVEPEWLQPTQRL